MLGLIGKPVLLELHRADIGQRRMQPSPVIPKQPSNGLVLGLPASLEFLPVQPLHLQRSEQGFAASVDAPMSSKRCRFFQVGQDKWVKFTNDIAL